MSTETKTKCGVCKTADADEYPCPCHSEKCGMALCEGCYPAYTKQGGCPTTFHVWQHPTCRFCKKQFKSGDEIVDVMVAPPGTQCLWVAHGAHKQCAIKAGLNSAAANASANWYDHSKDGA